MEGERETDGGGGPAGQQRRQGAKGEVAEKLWVGAEEGGGLSAAV